jgi:hypothetical protein
VVVAISFSFYGIDFVGNAFQFPGMDVRFALINEAVPWWTSVFSFSFTSYLCKNKITQGLMDAHFFHKFITLATLF